VDIRSRANTTRGLDYEHMIKARAHKGGVRIGKTPKKLASICCISFMAKDVERFFMYLLSTYISSFKNCLFSSFFHLFDGLLILCRVRFLRFLKSMANNA
jgi:hypothetical protein